jgi:hypothetical protein
MGISMGAYTAPFVSGEFSPAIIPDLSLWLDAADSSTLYDAVSGGSLVGPDGLVARWQDKSGNARHATQATSGNRPIRRVAGLNARDAIEFSGGPHRLGLSSWPALTNATAFIVCRPDVSPRDGNILWNFGSRADSSYFSYTGGTHGVIYDGFGTNDRRQQNAPYDLDQQTNVFETVITSGTHENWLQGSSFMGQAACVVAWSSAPLIGASSLDVNTGWGGKIVELVIYGTALSSQNRSLVRNYLATKWGATVI